MLAERLMALRGMGYWKYSGLDLRLGPAGPQGTRIVDLGQGWPQVSLHKKVEEPSTRGSTRRDMHPAFAFAFIVPAGARRFR